MQTFQPSLLVEKRDDGPIAMVEDMVLSLRCLTNSLH